MMKILFVGTSTLNNTEEMIFASLEKYEDDVDLFIQGEKLEWNRDRDDRLIRETAGYDLVLFTCPQLFGLEAIKQIKSVTTVVYIYTETDNEADKYSFLEMLPAVTIVIATQFNVYIELNQMNVDVYFVALGADVDSYPPLNRKNFKHDVVFAGLSESDEILRYHSFYPFSIVPAIHSIEEEIIHIRSAKINLEFNTSSSGPTARMFKILGSGSFLLMQEFVGMQFLKFRRGVHYDTFKSKLEYEEKIHYYLSNDEARETIASKGRYAIVKYDYTIDFFANELLRISKEYT